MKEEEKLSSGSLFMAFGGGRETTDAVVYPKYIGIGVFNVIALNPTMAESEKIYGRELEKEPEYTSVEEETGANQVRLDFIIKTVPDKNNGIELLTKQSFFLKQEDKLNKDKTKVQVINAYGECTWVGVDDVATGAIPEKVATWFEGPYKKVVVGEEELTAFLKVYLNIPNKSYKKKNGEVVTLDNISDAEARLDNIANYFTGNVKEIKELIKLQPENKIKLAVGIKTTDEGKQYQDIFSRMPIRNSIADYSKVDAAIKDAKANNAYSKTEFSIEPLHEYVVNATTFTEAPAGQPPVAAADLSNFFGGNDLPM